MTDRSPRRLSAATDRCLWGNLSIETKLLVIAFPKLYHDRAALVGAPVELARESELFPNPLDPNCSLVIQAEDPAQPARCQIADISWNVHGHQWESPAKISAGLSRAGTALILTGETPVPRLVEEADALGA